MIVCGNFHNEAIHLSKKSVFIMKQTGKIDKNTSKDQCTELLGKKKKDLISFKSLVHGFPLVAA